MVQTPRDPELDAILTATRQLTGQAHKLARSIDETLDDLQEFVDDLHPNRGLRRVRLTTYEGPERRDIPRA